MKYFTKRLWSDLQQPGDIGLEASRRWDENAAAYVDELDSLRGRVPPDVFDFFKSADVHDGALIHLRIRDFDPSAPRPGGEPDETGSDDGPWEGPYLLTVELIVCNSDDRFDTQWTLIYGHIRRILVDFPTASPLFFDPGGGFEDWGYHELSDAGDGFLRHEVLFASGSVVLIEFRDVSVERLDRPSSFAPS